MNWNPEMEYFELLKLTREPFSNSPDPELFYPTKDYLQALQKLEIAIRLRRGLNLVLGEVGTGKTTMSRVLLRCFEAERERFSVHLLLDPGFPSDQEMLAHLLRLLGGEPSGKESRMALMDNLQHILLRETLEKNRVVVLFIDEGQKLSPSSLETLRELLNFESNNCKLLQMVVFAQKELWERLQEMPNLLDRVNLMVWLKPMNLHETRAMVHHRLSQCGMAPHKQLFAPRAVRLIHKLSQGHPRKIINLCHHSMLKALMAQAEQVDVDSVKGAYSEIKGILARKPEAKTSKRIRGRDAALGSSLAAGAILLALLGAAGLMSPPQSPLPEPQPEAAFPGFAARIQEHEMGQEGLAGFSETQEPSVPSEPPQPEKAVLQPQPLVLSPQQWLEKLGDSGRLDSGVRVVVRKGDTLSALVERNLGMVLDPESEWMRRFRRANPGIANPDRLQPGDSLILPVTKEPAEEVQAQLLAWFPWREKAEAWASQELQRLGEGTLILAREQREGSSGYGIFRSTAGHGSDLDGISPRRIGIGEMLQVLTMSSQAERVEP